MSRLPVRVRLTLAFMVVMALVLTATGAFVLLRVESELDAGIDQSLRSRAADLAGPAAAGSPLGPGTEEGFARVIKPGDEGGTTLTAAELARARRRPVFVNRAAVRGVEGPARLYARPLRTGGVLVVSAGVDDRNEALDSLLAALVVGGLVALALASLAGYGLASAALRPVDWMRARAAAISRLGGDARLPVPPARDELAELGTTLNEMLGRLEASMKRERGFIATASHELRTPLALLKGELELALRKGRSPGELRAAIVAAAEETDRLAQLADDLLVLARVDEGQLPVHSEQLTAGELLEEAARRFEPRAAEAGRGLDVDPGPELGVTADRLRVEQALGNMIDNALRYGDGPITLAAVPAGEGVELHVRDRGPGLEPELRHRAFERFARADRGRGRGGAGLGLAIVAAVAEAHGGRAGVAERPDGGVDVWICLPGTLIAGSSEPDRPPAQEAIEGEAR